MNNENKLINNQWIIDFDAVKDSPEDLRQIVGRFNQSSISEQIKVIEAMIEQKDENRGPIFEAFLVDPGLDSQSARLASTWSIETLPFESALKLVRGTLEVERDDLIRSRVYPKIVRVAHSQDDPEALVQTRLFLRDALKKSWSSYEQKIGKLSLQGLSKRRSKMGK